jgi:hypothetical protein
LAPERYGQDSVQIDSTVQKLEKKSRVSNAPPATRQATQIALDRSKGDYGQMDCECGRNQESDARSQQSEVRDQPMRSGASRNCVPKLKLGYEEIGNQNPDDAGQTALDSPKGQFARMEL